MNTRCGAGSGAGWWQRRSNVVLVAVLAGVSACDGCCHSGRGGGSDTNTSSGDDTDMSSGCQTSTSSGCSSEEPCQADSECQDSYYGMRQCMSGYCRECEYSFQCPEGEACDLSSHECRPDYGDTDHNGTCRPGVWLWGSGSDCGECSDDSECPSPRVCVDHVCVMCGSEAECGQWERCIDGACFCHQPCSASGECATGTCGVDGCCGPEPACRDGEGTPCDGSGDDYGELACGSRDVCSPVCGGSEPECGSGDVCQPAPGRRSTCIPSGCPERVSCSVCMPQWDTLAVICPLSGDAEEGASCVFASGNPRERCGPGLFCIGRVCEPPCRVGLDECGEGDECVAAFPESAAGELGVCGTPCNPGDCPAGQRCQPVELLGGSMAGRCRPVFVDSVPNAYCPPRETLWCATDVACDAASHRCRQICWASDFCPEGESCHLLPDNVYGFCDRD